ncbi:MAG: hypothetical protein ACP5D8_08220 [Fidelibacterota bacterium]
MALQKREKILLGLAGIAVLIFAATKVIPMLSKDKPAAPTVSTTVAQQVTASLPAQSAAASVKRVPLKSYSTRTAWNLEWKSDPFVYSEKPEEETAIAKVEEIPEETSHHFELNGISWLNNKPTVLINDQILKPGDTIEGYTLSLVKPEYVILIKNGERIRLTFSEGAFVPGRIFR